MDKPSSSVIVFEKQNPAARSTAANRKFVLPVDPPPPAAPLFVSTTALCPEHTSGMVQAFAREGLHLTEVDMKNELTITALKADIAKNGYLRHSPLVVGGYFGGVSVHLPCGEQRPGWQEIFYSTAAEAARALAPQKK